MMPTTPITHLIICQAALTLPSTKTLLNAICRLDHTSIFVKVNMLFAIRQIVIASLRTCIISPLAHYQYLFIANIILYHRSNTTCSQANRQPPFMSLTNLDCLPTTRQNCLCPLVNAHQVNLTTSFTNCRL